MARLHLIVVRHPLCVLLAAVVLAACGQKSDTADHVIRVADDDPAMAAAVAKARASLPQFWDVFAHRSKGETNFNLKVPITDSHGTEFFWLSDIEQVEGKISGIVDNEPEIVHNVKIGERREIAPADIADWMYQRNGKIVGNESMRALFPKMSPQEAAQYRQMLADP